MKLKPLRHVLFLLTIATLSSVTCAETVWVDVRTSFEHLIDSIEGDVRITHTDITKKASEVFPDKNTEIRLYCRSGHRAEMALSALKEAGYTNVFNAGSIDDARRERGLAN